MSYNSNTKTVNVRLPENIVRILDELVDKGYFSSKSEAIRFFIRKYLRGDRFE